MGLIGQRHQCNSVLGKATICGFAQITVLAGHSPFLKIGARANRFINIGKINKVTGITGLGWNKPSGFTVFPNMSGFCNLSTALLSHVHNATRFLSGILLIGIYTMSREKLLLTVLLLGIYLRHGKNHVTGLRVRTVRTYLGSPARQHRGAKGLPTVQESVLEYSPKNRQQKGQETLIAA
jgi:hypothetical protein